MCVCLRWGQQPEHLERETSVAQISHASLNFDRTTFISVFSLFFFYLFIVLRRSHRLCLELPWISFLLISRQQPVCVCVWCKCRAAACRKAKEGRGEWFFFFICTKLLVTAGRILFLPCLRHMASEAEENVEGTLLIPISPSFQIPVLSYFGVSLFRWIGHQIELMIIHQAIECRCRLFSIPLFFTDRLSQSIQRHINKKRG